MNIFENKNNSIPEYYPFMYLDGYTPEQILFASTRKLYKDCMEKKSESPSIKIESEIKIK